MYLCEEDVSTVESLRKLARTDSAVAGLLLAMSMSISIQDKPSFCEDSTDDDIEFIKVACVAGMFVRFDEQEAAKGGKS